MSALDSSGRPWDKQNFTWLISLEAKNRRKKIISAIWTALRLKFEIEANYPQIYYWNLFWPILTDLTYYDQFCPILTNLTYFDLFLPILGYFDLFSPIFT